MNDAHDNVLLHGEYLEAALELGEIAQAKRELAEREKRCKELLEKMLSVGERGVDKDNVPIVVVRKGAARFSSERAAEALPNEVLLKISVFTPDLKLAKQVLPPAMFEQCLDYNKASVVAL